MARLKDYYVDTVAPALMKKFNYKSVMEIPKLDKVIVNVGAGEAISNSKVIDAIVNDITQITGQKPVICRAKKSVANFKLREGMPIGVKVTLNKYLLNNIAYPLKSDVAMENANCVYDTTIDTKDSVAIINCVLQIIEESDLGPQK